MVVYGWMAQTQHPAATKMKTKTKKGKRKKEKRKRKKNGLFKPDSEIAGKIVSADNVFTWLVTSYWYEAYSRTCIFPDWPPR